MSTILPHSDLDTLHNRLIEEIPRGSSVLDVGAGLAKYHSILLDRGCSLTLIDAHKPYLEERQKRFPNAALRCVCAPATVGMEVLRSQGEQFDVVLGIDFVEHVDRIVAQACIYFMRLVGQKIVLFVPEGNHPQDTDHYGMGADHWQTHRSIWQAEDLEALGFTVERWVDFHRWNPKSDPGALWATWRRP